MQRFDDATSVGGAVEEIGIAEGDMVRARADLRRDVGLHDVGLHDSELTVVNRHHRAVPAQMTTSSAGLGVADQRARAVGTLQGGVAVERR